MVDYVAEQMGRTNISGGDVYLAASKRDLIEALKQKKVDWVSESPYLALLLVEKAGGEIMLNRWKEMVPESSAIFFTRNDNNINTLADLKGKTIAFEDPISTVAYCIPLAMLRQKGYRVVHLKDPQKKPPMGAVGYFFSGGRINTSTWVYRKLADVGVCSDLNWESSEDTPKHFKKEFKVLHQSKYYPSAIEVVRKDLAPEIKEDLLYILKKADQDPAAKQSLKMFNSTARFTDLDASVKARLQEIRQMMTLLTKEELE